MKLQILAQHKQEANEQYWWHLFKDFNVDKKVADFQKSRLYNIFVKNIGREQKILDAGCGTGKITFSLLKSGYAVTGLDYSKQLLSKVKTAVPEHATKFVFGDVRKLPFKKETFDVYISPGVVEHFQKNEQDKIIREAHRILKRNGKTLFIVPYINLLSQVQAKRILKKEAIKKAKGIPFYQYRYSEPAVISLLKENSFEPEKTYLLGLHDTKVFGIKLIPKFLQNNTFLLKIFGTTICVLARKV